MKIFLILELLISAAIVGLAIFGYSQFMLFVPELYGYAAFKPDIANLPQQHIPAKPANISLLNDNGELTVQGWSKNPDQFFFDRLKVQPYPEGDNRAIFNKMKFKAFNQMVVFTKDYIIYTGIVDFYFNVFTYSSIVVKSEGQMRTVVDFSDFSELDYSKISVDDYSYLDASDNLIIKFTKNADQKAGSRSTVYDFYNRALTLNEEVNLQMTFRDKDEPLTLIQPLSDDKRHMIAQTKYMGIPTVGTIEFEGGKCECKPKECTANLQIQRGVIPYGEDFIQITASGYLKDGRSFGFSYVEGLAYLNSTNANSNGFTIDGKLYKLDQMTGEYQRYALEYGLYLETQHTINFKSTCKVSAKSQSQYETSFDAVLLMKELYISHSLIEGECVTESGEKISFDNIEGLVVYDRALM